MNVREWFWEEIPGCQEKMPGCQKQGEKAKVSKRDGHDRQATQVICHPGDRRTAVCTSCTCPCTLTCIQSQPFIIYI